jgi:hypothetical protein
MHAGIGYVGRVAVGAGLSGAQLSHFTIPADSRLAGSFHAVASRLHATRERWDDAAVLHLFAASLRGPADSRSLTDFLLAADLFSGAGDSGAACAALERAAAVAVRVGRLGDARYCRQRVKLTGSSGCSQDWGTLLTDLVVPAPGAIYVEAPDPRTRALFRSDRSDLPAAPGPIIVDPPDLVRPISIDADAAWAAPILVPPRITWPEV